MAERARGAHRDEENETKAEDVKPEVQSSSNLDEEPTKEDAAKADEVADRIVVKNHDENDGQVEFLTTQASRVTRK